MLYLFYRIMVTGRRSLLRCGSQQTINTMGRFKLLQELNEHKVGEIINVHDNLDRDMIRFKYGVQIIDSKVEIVEETKIEVAEVNKAVIPKTKKVKK